MKNPETRGKWTPLSIAVMVIGFIIWWPLGLAALAYILWRRPRGPHPASGRMDRERWRDALRPDKGAGARRPREAPKAITDDADERSALARYVDRLRRTPTRNI